MTTNNRYEHKRKRAAQLLDEGLTRRQISKRLRVSYGTVTRWLSASKPLCEDSISPRQWKAFLKQHLDTGEEGRTVFAGVVLSGTQVRSVHRWQKEGSIPRLFTVDRFLTIVGLHLSDFELFCSERRRSMWARGRPPAWMSAA